MAAVSKVLGLLMLLSSLGQGAEILAIIPVFMRSHFVVIQPLLEALASRGHNVTVYSCFPQERPHDNITHVDCSEGRDLYFNNQDFQDIKKRTSNLFTLLYSLFNMAIDDCKSFFERLDFDSIKNKGFDILITEAYLDDCNVHFAYKLNIPIVSVATMPPWPWIPDTFGLPDNPSYIPHCSLNSEQKMSFYERLMNTILIAYAKALYVLVASPRYHRAAEEYFQETLPWIRDVAKNSSLLLINSHPTIGISRPLPPNVVEVGGIHIKKKNPLDKDLQTILDNSPQGVILFSFGSIVRVSTTPKDKRQMILNVFSKIPQTVLFKYEEDLSDVPTNVILKKWLPQRDILEHENVVAVITHCGLASIMEAIHCAKPVLGMPIFTDQYPNINSLVSKGAGLMVDFDSMTEAAFGQSLDQILHNRTYTENMKKVSAQFRDRPQSALKLAVYWTEYVLRHKGAPHLRPASTSLPFYQLWLLDVFAVLLTGLAITAFAVYWLFKIVLSGLRFITIKDYDRSKKIN